MRCSATPRCSRAATRSRSSGRSSTRSSRPGGATGRTFRTTRRERGGRRPRPRSCHATAAPGERTSLMDAEQLGSWEGEDVSIGMIEPRLAELRHRDDGDPAELRTSVMTHIAWVPQEWEQAAAVTRSGLGARHPSRAIVLYPRPDVGSDRIDARVTVEAYGLPGLERHVSAEVIELWLCGN